VLTRPYESAEPWWSGSTTWIRPEFRDLFEVHFARFDAKLEQRAPELRAEFQRGLAQLEAKA
jgi:hypothetical protein